MPERFMLLGPSPFTQMSDKRVGWKLAIEEGVMNDNRLGVGCQFDIVSDNPKGHDLTARIVGPGPGVLLSHLQTGTAD